MYFSITNIIDKISGLLYYELWLIHHVNGVYFTTQHAHV